MTYIQQNTGLLKSFNTSVLPLVVGLLPNGWYFRCPASCTNRSSVSDNVTAGWCYNTVSTLQAIALLIIM